jgi:hypothetical protein
MAEPSDNRGRSKRRRALAAAVYVALLAAALAAAWQIHEVWIAPASEPLGPVADLGETGRARPDDARGPEVADLLDLPMAWQRLELLEGDPGGLAPPPGARRRFACRFNTPDQRIELAKYHHRGTVASVRAHYAAQTAAAGFEALGESNVGGRETLVFGKAEVVSRDGGAAERRTEVRVALHRLREDEKMVSILCAVLGPVR